MNLWNLSLWNLALWNGPPVIAQPFTPLRRACLTAPFTWEQSLGAEFSWIVNLQAAMGCSVAEVVNIQGQIIGDHLRVSLALSNLPVDKTIISATIFVKESRSDDDDDAIFFKSITSSQTEDGEIVDAGIDDTASMYFDVSDADTDSLIHKKAYWYFIRVECSDGVGNTPIHGKIVFERP